MIAVTEFIAKVRIPLEQHWGYIWGTWGRLWTDALQKAYSEPTRKNWQKTKAYGQQWVGHIVADCSGLVRWACNELGESVAHSSHYLYTDYCRKKGQLVKGLRQDGTQPRAGSLVFLTNAEKRKHHVGVYVGNNVVIEAKGTQWGVITSELSHWDSWGELKCISYNEETPVKPPETDTKIRQAIAVNPGSYLNLRQQPTKASRALAHIPKGAKVIVLNTNNTDWWKVKYQNTIGYAASQYLELI